MEISPLDGKIYFTAKGLNKVYRLQDNGTTASQVETFVGGLYNQLFFRYRSGNKNGSLGDGNDNLTFDELDNLLGSSGWW
ncbi:hypothetical protein [Chryseobacterium wanjuense]